jgi:ATPase subunit of ABC transporter with duplicated ATPase domains
MVLVTHDSELLSACEHIAEITSGGTLQIYKSCTYEQYLDLKQQRASAALTQFEKNQKEAQRLQSFVDRFGASATKASAAQSRVKKIQRMEQDGLLERPSESILETERYKPRLKLPRPPSVFRGSDGIPLLAITNDAKIGYMERDGGKSSSSTTTTTTTTPKVLASNINFEIHPGMKILIRGPNGAGTSVGLLLSTVLLLADAYFVYEVLGPKTNSQSILSR